MSFWNPKPDLRAQQLAVLQLEIDLVAQEINHKVQESVFRLQQENRLTPYLFLALIGIAGIFQFVQLEPIVIFLTDYPVWILVCVILLMWFPVFQVIALNDIAKATLFIRDVAAPRLNDLVRQAREVAELPVGDIRTEERHFTWDSQKWRPRLVVRGLNLPIEGAVISPLSWFRSLVVAFPAALVFFAYYVPARIASATRHGALPPEPWPTGPEWLLYIVLGSLVVLIALSAVVWAMRWLRVRAPGPRSVRTMLSQWPPAASNP